MRKNGEIEKIDSKEKTSWSVMQILLFFINNLSDSTKLTSV